MASDFPPICSQSTRGLPSDRRSTRRLRRWRRAQHKNHVPRVRAGRTIKPAREINRLRITFKRSSVTIPKLGSRVLSSAKRSPPFHTFADPRLPDCLDALFSSPRCSRSILKQTSIPRDQIASVSTFVTPVSDVHIADHAVPPGHVDVRNGMTAPPRVESPLESCRNAWAGSGPAYSWTFDTDLSATCRTAIVGVVTRLQTAHSVD